LLKKGKKARRTSQIRSKVNENRSKNADVPMLYNNICKRPPMTERPAAASLTPNEAAAPLVEVELALLPDAVDVPIPATLFVVKQLKTP
jgi:hypothetical protein